MVGSGVKLFVQLNRIFGLAPFDMSLAVMAPKVVSQTSSITLRLHQMIPSYTALSFYSLCLASIFWQQRSGSQISATANWLQFIPNAFSYIVCLYAGIKNRALSEKILSTFHACDQKMQDSLGVSFRTYNSRANYLSYVASGVAISTGLAVFGLSYMNSVDWADIWSILYWIAFCLPKLSILLVNLQFASCVYYIISREQLIKKSLGPCFVNEGRILISPTDLSMTANTNQVFPVSTKKAPLHLGVEVQLRNCSALLEVVTSLQQLVDLINSYFGKQLVMNLMSAFVCITVQLHHTIRLIRQRVQPEGSELIVTFNSSLIALHTLEILMIFGCGDRAKAKWNDLIAEVQRIRQRVRDEGARGQLFEVLNTMYYKKLEFHGCNLFSIDLSVITGLISSVATYLIVLVQFQINEEQSGKYNPKEDTHSFSGSD